MKILIAGKFSPYGHKPIGGLQSWIKTVHEGLYADHDVTVWQAGDPKPSGRFDLGIMANYGDTSAVWPLCDRITNVCHGIIEAERPRKADTNVFTSEGVLAHWGIPGVVLRQPIDLNYWRPGLGPAWGRKGLLLRYSYRAGLPFVSQIAKDMGLEYTHARNVDHEQARSLFARSAVVLATGRAALEAMACGAPVVICDHRAAYQDALLHDRSLVDAMTHNYSGRGGVAPNAKNLREEIDKAIAAGSQRRHVETYHDARKIVAELIK